MEKATLYKDLGSSYTVMYNKEEIAMDADNNQSTKDQAVIKNKRLYYFKIAITLILVVGAYFLLLILIDALSGTYFALLMEEYVQSYGLYAVFVISFIFDSVISPFSPDLIVMVAVSYGGDEIIVPLVAGLASGLAGILDYYLGRLLAFDRMKKWIGMKNFERGKELFGKYGIWAILVGALTPVPYSAVCYVAGFFKMRFSMMIITALLARVPRFLILSYLSFIW